MPETINETYHPMAFDAIKIGLASPEKIRIPFTRPEIAAHLGCSVRTVNRTVQELAKENMIYLNKGKIFISEPQF